MVLVSAACFAGQTGTTTPQPSNDEDLMAAVVVMRHGVRAPIESEIRGSNYNRQPWAPWPVDAGVLTEHGAAALRLLGEFYDVRYGRLLGQSAKPDCQHSNLYVEANTSQRTIASAHALLSGIKQPCPAEVHVGPKGQVNPLFAPAHPELLDRNQFAAAIKGRMGNNLAWFRNAFARPLAQMEHVLNDCTDATGCGPAKPDFRNTPEAIEESAGRGFLKVETPVSLGADFAEHFLLEYTEGMPMQKVGWGRVDRATLDDLMEMNTRYHDFMLRTPAYAQAGASNLAAHILATLQSAGNLSPDMSPLGNQKEHVAFLLGHDSNLAWLGGLLHLDWLLPDETFDATPPGSALAFELHRNHTAGQLSIRVNFISQTLDQIRSLQPLTGTTGPAISPIFIPACNGYACTLEDFGKAVMSSIDERLVEHNH